MQIIVHRGYWKTQSDKNSLRAFQNAFEAGYGIETDFRDFKGELVISHDIAGEDSVKARELFQLYSLKGKELQIAINVKADGIQKLLKELIEEFRVKNYFLFDMSVPEMVVNRKMGLKFYTRQSDIEQKCVLYNASDGIWLDSFYKEDWLTKEKINSHLNAKKKISIISPEIHGKDKYKVWKMLKEEKIYKSSLVSICTDTPKEAEDYFYD